MIICVQLGVSCNAGAGHELIVRCIWRIFHNYVASEGYVDWIVQCGTMSKCGWTLGGGGNGRY